MFTLARLALVAINHLPNNCLRAPSQLAAALRGVDEWQYDSFQLDRASGGHALSCLAYHLMKRTQLIKQLHLSETRLARWVK